MNCRVKLAKNGSDCHIVSAAAAAAVPLSESDDCCHAATARSIALRKKHRKRPLFLNLSNVFVPSLSWQIDRCQYEKGSPKKPFLFPHRIRWPLIGSEGIPISHESERSDVITGRLARCKKTAPFSAFPYVCPEPVLVT
jgi:hypothetical protein